MCEFCNELRKEGYATLASVTNDLGILNEMETKLCVMTTKKARLFCKVHWTEYLALPMKQQSKSIIALYAVES